MGDAHADVGSIGHERTALRRLACIPQYCRFFVSSRFCTSRRLRYWRWKIEDNAKKWSFGLETTYAMDEDRFQWIFSGTLLILYLTWYQLEYSKSFRGNRRRSFADGIVQSAGEVVHFAGKKAQLSSRAEAANETRFYRQSKLIWKPVTRPLRIRILAFTLLPDWIWEASAGFSRKPGVNDLV